jgi:N-methylhydantoinase B
MRRRASRAAPTAGSATVRLNGKSIDHRTQYVLKKGDRVMVSTPGGGGYGRATQRDPKLIARDRERGYVGKSRSR